jgi:hypothetical protein
LVYGGGDFFPFFNMPCYRGGGFFAGRRPCGPGNHRLGSITPLFDLGYQALATGSGTPRPEPGQL